MNETCMKLPAVIFSLIGVAHEIERQFEDALATVNLSGAKFAALSVLVSQDGPVSLSELALKLTCVRSNITQLIDRLEKDGLVKRTDDPTDRRGVRAEVTSVGHERFADGEKALAVVHHALAEKLATIDEQALESALKALR
jgi:DNA-binding MarR family transcriptional regulator